MENKINQEELMSLIMHPQSNAMTDEDFQVFSQRKPKKLEWLWKPYILRGNLNIVVGDGGVGKSYFTSWLLSAISSGGKVPFNYFNFDMERAILQNAEDDLDATILPRLMANGANTDNIGFFNEENKTFAVQQLERLEDRLEKFRPAVVVLDPIQAYLGDINMNSAIEVRSALMPLKILAQKHNCAIILIMHLNKNSGTTKASNRVMGSNDFVTTCRSVLLIEKNPENQEERLLIPIKANLMKESEKNTLSYKITDSGKIEWLENKGFVDADEVLLENNNSVNKGDKVEQFILGVLSRGEIRANEFRDLALNVGNFSEKTFNVTRGRLRKENIIENFTQNKMNYWRLKEIDNSNI